MSYADEVEDVLAAAELLAKEGISCDVYKLVRIFPFEEELIRDLSAYPVVLMAEECVFAAASANTLPAPCRMLAGRAGTSTVP